MSDDDDITLEIHNVPDEQHGPHGQVNISNINEKISVSSIMSRKRSYDYGNWDGPIDDNSLCSNESQILNASKTTDLDPIILNDKLSHLMADIEKRHRTWFQFITFVRYKYDHFQKWNSISSVAVILMSSVITFLEALRTNISPSVLINSIFTITTLTFGFLIALLSSIIKFFNFQQQMENLKTAMNGLGHSYEAACKLLSQCEIEIILVKNDPSELNKFITNTQDEWNKIAVNAVQPMNAANNILNPKIISKYLTKFYKTENIHELIQNIHTRHSDSFKQIETNLKDIEGFLLSINTCNNDDDAKIEEMLHKIHKYGGQVNEYKSKIKHIFRDSMKYYGNKKTTDQL